ncbi:ABC transporter permease, partial [Escherichia coli]|uniref:ABC transporter permease n=1 Tax=Escherichia coli TaxID=562 RepID=UPI002118CF3C
RQFEIQGLDPMVLLVVPRALAFALGAFCMATVLLLSTLLTGYLIAHGLGLVAYSIWDFSDMVQRAMTVRDFIVPPLKCVV